MQNLLNAINRISVINGTKAPQEPNGLLNNLVSYYKADTNGSFPDAHGSNDGTINGATYTESGKINGAYSFTTNDYINVLSDASLDDLFNGGGSLVFWIKPNGSGQNNQGRVLDKRNAGEGWTILPYVGSPNTIQLFKDFSGVDGQWRTTTEVFNQNTWQHIVITYDSSSDTNNPLIYINGISDTLVEESSPSGTAQSDASQDLYIGNRANIDRAYDGLLDEIGFYNGFLDSEQVLALYNNDKGLPYSKFTN